MLNGGHHFARIHAHDDFDQVLATLPEVRAKRIAKGGSGSEASAEEGAEEEHSVSKEEQEKATDEILRNYRGAYVVGGKELRAREPILRYASLHGSYRAEDEKLLAAKIRALLPDETASRRQAQRA